MFLANLHQYLITLISCMGDIMTPLFPENHVPIIIKQGSAGDCFLLTTLDCLLNQDDEGRLLIRSLFTEHSDGSISVKIKRTDQSINLNPQQLYGKYLSLTA